MKATLMTSHKSRKRGSTYWKIVDDSGNNVALYIANKATAEKMAQAAGRKVGVM